MSASVQSTSVQTDEVINFTPTIQIPDSSDHENSSNKKSSNSCENDPTITFLTPNSDAVKLHRSLQKIQELGNIIEEQQRRLDEALEEN